MTPPRLSTTRLRSLPSRPHDCSGGGARCPAFPHDYTSPCHSPAIRFISWTRLTSHTKNDAMGRRGILKAMVPLLWLRAKTIATRPLFQRMVHRLRLICEGKKGGGFDVDVGTWRYGGLWLLWLRDLPIGARGRINVALSMF